MHFSRILSGAGRLARSAARAAAASLPTAPTRRSAVVCVLLAGATAACTVWGDADDARARDAIASAPRSDAPAVPDAHRTPTVTVRATNETGPVGSVSRAVVATDADTLLANADVYAGWRNFNVNCQGCHGFNAVASDAAPDLRNSVRKGGTLTRAQFHEVVRKGRMAKGMPAWGALLDAKQIDQIYAYLLARSSGALGAGQPSVGGE